MSSETGYGQLSSNPGGGEKIQNISLYFRIYCDNTFLCFTCKEEKPSDEINNVIFLDSLSNLQQQMDLGILVVPFIHLPIT